MADPISASLAAATRPATLLIEKVSNAIGRHFDPRQAIRMAEAEAEAGRIRAVGQTETEIEVAELRQRAAERFVEEQMRMQSNMESIAAKAIPHLTDDAEPDKIDDDWVSNFFDKSRIVSDEQMQELWGKILAGEGNNPGRFSRKTVNLIADLDKRDAELFTNLCRFAWRINGSYEPLVYDPQLTVYNQLGINFSSIGHLEALGLVRHSGATSFIKTNLPNTASAVYATTEVTLTFPSAEMNQLDVGEVLFTNYGRQLLSITGVQVAEGFFIYVYDLWASQSLVPPREQEPRVYFHSLAKQWLAETAIHSNPAIISRHPAYSQIIGLGHRVIPLILSEVSEGRNRPHWFQVLYEITGMTPAQEDSWGNVEAVAAAWVEWGKKEGHLS